MMKQQLHEVAAAIREDWKAIRERKTLAQLVEDDTSIIGYEELKLIDREPHFIFPTSEEAAADIDAQLRIIDSIAERDSPPKSAAIYDALVHFKTVGILEISTLIDIVEKAYSLGSVSETYEASRAGEEINIHYIDECYDTVIMIVDMLMSYRDHNKVLRI